MNEYPIDTPLLERMRLDGKVALVTGGHGGLAGAIAHTLAELGGHVALAARHGDECELLAAELRARHGIEAIAASVDVTDEEGVALLIETVVDKLGGLDVVVNNAATFWAAPPTDVPIDRGWRRVIDVNLTGTFIVCQAAARVMLERQGGSIINVTSSGAFMSYLPEAGSTLSYTTSKGAIVTLTRDLAAQWGTAGIRVNALAPGLMEAGMMETVPDERRRRMEELIPMGRRGRPDELMGAIAYLASSLSSYVTGSVLVVDGGQTIV